MPTAVDTDVRLRLRAGGDPAAARRLVKSALTSWRVDQRLDDALLIATELVENVVRHTHAGGRLRVRMVDGAVRIEVSDHSDAPPRLLRLLDRPAQGGLGIFLVNSIADRWGFHAAPDGKVVWAEIDAPA